MAARMTTREGTATLVALTSDADPSVRQSRPVRWLSAGHTTTRTER